MNSMVIQADLRLTFRVCTDPVVNAEMSVMPGKTWGG
jgi:hypothetical protein